ncbi:MAG: 2Fe-2S iron-sulfur cluster binding domain-containing protein [Campylobacteraceae bacterium]|nr:2Fe-2S iron-sulfur cluster binding domain-containing protein [Campylobacteraceae bacterium]NQY54114.1 2Fe-2S iron-sulfur cluster binding domain-containing protein [Campylobacteraceae bacterium]
MSILQLSINGQKVGPIEIPDEVMMIEYLHEFRNLTGTKFGCGQGACGACTVIVENEDGTKETKKTCINSAAVFNNKKVTTIEGHATKDKDNNIVKLNPVQEVFIEQFAFQCGWCTSGFVNKATLLMENLEKNPIKIDQVEKVIEENLKDHICRCTGYVKYYQGMKKLILGTKGLTV